MAIKKKTSKPGPKALLMKKSVDQLKRKAKQLKVKNYSTKKKAQLVQSIMLAEARKKRKPGTKRKTAAKKSAIKSISTRVTMRGSTSLTKQPRKAFRQMSQPQGRGITKAEFMGSVYQYDSRIEEASKLLHLLSLGAISDIAQHFWYRMGNFYVCWNDYSDTMFLEDEDSNVLINIGGQLDMLFSSPYEGVEGTYEELKEQYNDLHREDQEWFNDLYRKNN